MAKRSLVLTGKGPGGRALPLGDRREVLSRLEACNTAPDGGPPRTSGMVTCYGPGLVLEYASGHDEIQQAMVTMNEEDLAWAVLQNLCKRHGWMLMDLETGRSFG
jgi:hypothetical protein